MVSRASAIAALASMLCALAAGDCRALAPEESQRPLPEAIVRDICKQYDEKPAYESDGETTRIDCDWIRKLATITRPTAIETNRRILDQASTLNELKHAKFPPDINCGRFAIQLVGKNRALVCEADLGEKVPYVFLADRSGRLLRLETILDYRSILRAAMARSLEKGKISAYHDAYVDLNTDLMIAKLRFTASPLDSVKIENGRISIVMEASNRPAGKKK